MSAPSDERRVYRDLKNEHQSAEKTIQSRLRAQKNVVASHYNQQMKALDQQFQETERRRKAQQAMLRGRYKLQRQQMKQRHAELLHIKGKLRDISDKEHRQVEHETKLRQRYQRVQEIQTDYQNREEKAKSNRDLLVDRKKAIQQEMEDLNALTKQIDQLNLGAEQTEEQKQQMESFIAQNPDLYQSDDRVKNNSRRVRNRYSAYDDEESEFKEIETEYSEHRAPRRSHRRRGRRDSRSVRRSEHKRRDSRRRRSSRRTSKRISLKMTIEPRKSDSDQVQQSVKRTDSRSERRSGRKSRSVERQSTRESTRSTTSRRSTRSRRDSGRSERRRSSRSQRHRVSRYENKSGNLYVRLVNARSVFGSKGSLPNTYVEMECDGQVQESSMIHSGDVVRGDECFKFAIEDYDESMLTIRLIDADRDETIAKVRIPTVEFVDMANSGDLDSDEAAPVLKKQSTMSKIKRKLSRKSSSKRKQSR